MTQAISLFTTIWAKILNNIFNSMDIGGGVTIGWIIIVVAMMAILLRTILPQVSGISRNNTARDIERSKKGG